MGLESGSFPSDLVSSNPQGADDKSQGDDHIRLIKNVIKTTFPNIDGAVTATQDELNLTSDPTLFFQTGMIIMWSGSVLDIPDGFLLCNGGSGTPNLTDRFIVGTVTDAGGNYDVGDVGGTTSNAHTHTASAAGHALTKAEMPAHSHISGIAWYSGAYGTGSIANTNIPAGSNSVYSLSPNTQSVGSNAAHTHGVTVNAKSLDNRPPYYALAFIMKS